MLEILHRDKNLPQTVLGIVSLIQISSFLRNQEPDQVFNINFWSSDSKGGNINNNSAIAGRKLALLSRAPKKKNCGVWWCIVLTNSHIVTRVIGTTDTTLMPQLAREELRVKAICVSLEWCVIDNAALWQFVNNGSFFFMRRFFFQCECLQPRQRARKQAIKFSTHTHTHTHTHRKTRSTSSASLPSFTQHVRVFHLSTAVSRILLSGCSITSCGVRGLARPTERLINPN